MRSFGRLLHRLTTCHWPLAVSLASCSFTARLLACGPLARSSFDVAEPRGSFFLCRFVRCIVVVLHHVVHTQWVLHIHCQLVLRKNVRPRRHGGLNFLVMPHGIRVWVAPYQTRDRSSMARSLKAKAPNNQPKLHRVEGYAPHCMCGWIPTFVFEFICHHCPQLCTHCLITQICHVQQAVHFQTNRHIARNMWKEGGGPILLE